jgi:hypothetical protein
VNADDAPRKIATVVRSMLDAALAPLFVSRADIITGLDRPTASMTARSNKDHQGHSIWRHVVLGAPGQVGGASRQVAAADGSASRRRRRSAGARPS